MRSALPLVAALSLACAKQQLPPIAQLSAAREARCRSVSDSIFANVPHEELPLAGRPTHLSQVRMRVPDAVPAGVPLKVSFLVRPDGTSDTATVAITGTDDAGFRRDAMMHVSQTTFTSAEIDGCPVWSREEIVTVKSGTVRTNGLTSPPTTRL